MDNVILVPGQFLSTLSLRRATKLHYILGRIYAHFYPRSPCGERPAFWAWCWAHCWHFYPRSPCGERPHHSPLLSSGLYFYPRSPCGERPFPLRKRSFLSPISIHALLAESDFFAHVVPVQHRRISIHALLAESDLTVALTIFRG